MKVYTNPTQLNKKIKNAVVAIGVFDGIHKGHQQLIRHAVKGAKKNKGKAVVITFDPHPVHVLYPQDKLPLIISVPYRLLLLERLGVDSVLVMKFTSAFSRLSPEVFIKRYLVDKIGVREVYVGEDFRFGQNRAGTLKIFEQAARKYGFKVHGLTIRQQHEEKISSTTIRDMIGKGDLKKAKRLLGRPVSIMGEVTRGDERGKTLGYPTANVHPSNGILPPRGVYIVSVEHRQKVYHGIGNIGYRPSFLKGGPMTVEVHMFRLKKSIYGQPVIIRFLKKIRDERPFQTKGELIAQLQKDEGQAKWFRSNKS